MGGTNRRRQQRPSTPPGQPAPARVVKPKPQWRETFDSWGGVPVFGALAGGLVIIALLIYSNRAGSSVGTAAFAPFTRAEVNGRLAGKADAPVKIIEFADFQCPFCKQWTDNVEKQLLDEFVNTGRASIQYVSFAFLGEESKRAAQAAECAADQKRFWEYHDLLFARQGKENSGVFSAINLKKFGAELKGKYGDFDTAKFDECVDSGEKAGAIDAQTKQARDAGVQSTPSFIVNGASLSGVQPIDTFRQAIIAAETAAKK